MRNIYTVEAIQETKTFKELESKGEQFRINLLLQRRVREKISNAVAVWKNTNHVPTTVVGIDKAVVEDLIRMQGTDYSNAMTAEEIYDQD